MNKTYYVHVWMFNDYQHVETQRSLNPDVIISYCVKLFVFWKSLNTLFQELLSFGINLTILDISLWIQNYGINRPKEIEIRNFVILIARLMYI